MLNEELIKFDNWIKSSKLSVNIKKNNYVDIKTAQKKTSSTLPLFLIIKFLKNGKIPSNLFGVYTDNSLTGKCHINHVCKNVSKTIGVVQFQISFLSYRKKKHCSLFTKL